MSLLRAVVVLAALVSTQGPADPAFGPGSLTHLTCKVVKEETGKLFSARLWVEVSNAGTLAAEPLEFLVRQELKKVKGPTGAFEAVAARAAFPFASRYGRPVPAGGKNRYWLQVGSGDSGDVNWTVKVTRAAWYKGTEVPKPNVKIGTIEQVSMKDIQGQETTVSRVKLMNPTQKALDLVFRATVKQPREGEALVGVRVPPGELDWLIAELRPNLGFEQDTPSNPIRIDKLELVDWCVLGDADPAAAADLFVPAYRNWLHWKKPFPSLTGRFSFSSEASVGSGRSAAGTFRMDAEGAVELRLDAGAAADGSDPTSDVVKTIVNAFADLRRADALDLTEKGALRIVADGVVELDGTAMSDAGVEAHQAHSAKTFAAFTPNYTVRGGRIVGSGDRTGFDHWTWSTQPMGGGYVVNQRKTVKGDWCYQYTYTEAGGLVFPSAIRQYFGTVTGTLLSQYQVTLEDVKLDTGGAPVAEVPPAGPGAAALRQAWDAGYAYPDAPKELTARFEVKNPGTDMVWQGHKALQGTVKIKGFRGFRIGGLGWTGYEADLTAALSDGQERALGFVLFDRFVLWAGRDYNGRGEFAKAFAGATIEAPTAEGEFRVAGARYKSLTVKDGNIVALTTSSGVERKLTWTRIGKQHVMTRVQTGDEDLTVKFASVGEVLVPVEMEFRSVFGKDWGPETIRLTDVKLK